VDDLRFAILGPVRAWRGSVALDLGPAKQVATLGVLLLNANRPVGTAQLVDAVWDTEPPADGANAVQKQVAGLRRTLAPAADPRSPAHPLQRTAGGYLLTVSPGALDVDTFRGAVQSAEAARLAASLDAAATSIRTALDLWQADALAGLPGRYFDAARRQLADAHAAAWETWAEIELAAGLAPIPELLRLVDEYPLRERLRALLIRALHRSGRQAEALAAFAETRRYLVEEYGVEPGQQLQDLHAEILRGAPAPAPVLVGAPAVVTPAPVVVEGAPRPTVGRWVAWSVPILVALFSLGLATWAVTGYHAVRRRSRRLALWTLAYFGGDVLIAATINGPASAVGVLTALGMMFGGAVHAAMLGPVPAWKQRMRRAQAVHLLRHDPALARELAIGRPDLPRAFDDGGLVDVNSAPEYALASVPGISPEQAHRVVAHRAAYGPTGTVADLAAAGLLPTRLSYRLRMTLIALPPQHE
jgi:DNA-binding SARP family transcriptional activator